MGHSDFDSGPCLLHASKIIACQRLVESGTDVNAASTKSFATGSRTKSPETNYIALVRGITNDIS